MECSRRLLPTHPFVREAMQHAVARAADLTKKRELDTDHHMVRKSSLESEGPSSSHLSHLLLRPLLCGLEGPR